MRYDLGCGIPERMAPGHIGIDLVSTADIVWNLEKGLPPEVLAKGEHAEGVRAHQLLEHLHTAIPLMNDVYKILKPGALFELSTPVAGTKEFWQDPTHVKGYVLDSFYYFMKDSIYPDAQKEYGITCRFTIVKEFVERGWNLQVVLTK